MTEALWFAVIGVAVGTLAMRMLPLLWMQRRQHLSKSQAGVPHWLSVLAPMMIAAMLGASLMPATPSPSAWLATLVGGLATLAVWRKTHSLGWPVICGVVSFAMVKLAAILIVL